MLVDGVVGGIAGVDLTDSAIAVSGIAMGCQEPKESLIGSRHYSYLESIDFHEDLDYCLSLNHYDIVPEYRGGVVRVG